MPSFKDIAMHEAIRNAIRGAEFPASKQHLMDYAKQQNASDEVMSELHMLSEHNYQDADAVIEEIRHAHQR